MLRPVLSAPLRIASASRVSCPLATTRATAAGRRMFVLSSRANASPSPNDAFANTTNAYYADEMYRRWKQDPKSVHSSWDTYFSGMEGGLPSSHSFQLPPTALTTAGAQPPLDESGGHPADDYLKLQLLVRAYQVPVSYTHLTLPMKRIV